MKPENAAYVRCLRGLPGCPPLSLAELHVLEAIETGRPDGDARIRIHLSGLGYAFFGARGLQLDEPGRTALRVFRERLAAEEASLATLGEATPSGDPVDMDGLTSDTKDAWDGLVAAAKAQLGFDLVPRSARRTCAQQAEQYAIGRGGPNDTRTPVTYAMGCNSRHVVGRAVDFIIYYSDGRKSYLSSDYTAVGELAESLGWFWGGRLQGFGPNGDEGHVQWDNGHTIQDLCPDPTQCVDIPSSPRGAASVWGWKGVFVGCAVGLAVVGAGVGGMKLAHHLGEKP